MNLEASFMPLLIAFAWMSGFMLLGTFLRARIKFFQKFLFPACLIGGVLGFVVMSLGWIKVGYNIFALIAFHLFSIGFVSVGLTGGGNMKGLGKTVLKGSVWMGLVWTVSLCVQSIAGAGVVMGINQVLDPIYAGLGFLVGHGYTQGPGQTLAIASVWQNTFKIPDAISIGLSFAAAGFFVAAFVGVPLANWGVRKGYATNAPKDLPNEFLTGILDRNTSHSAGKLTTHPANVDTMAIHMAILGLTYGLAYIVCYLLKTYLFKGPMQAMAFGFIFFWGLLVAMVVRFVMGKLKIAYLIDDNVQRRVTGTTVDFLIVATMMAVKLTVVLTYIVQLTLVCVVVAILTLIIIMYFGRRIADFSFERMVALFGYCTGTAASGLLLLRIVDPEFKTPVAMEVGLMNLIATFTATHLIFLVGGVPAPTTLSVAALIGVEAATALGCLILLKVFRLWGKPVY